MFKKSIFFIICVICFLICVISGYAQEETLTITTYYPSPYGSYNELYVADKLGIGTTTPYGGLHIKKDIAHLNLQSNTVDEFVDLRFYDADDAYANPKWSLAYMGSLRGNDLYLDRGIAGTGNNVMTWDYATGNVGIGTTQPDRTLVVGSSTTNEDHIIGIDAPRGNIAGIYFNEAGVPKWGIGRFAGNDDLRFGDATNERMRIQQTTGDVGIGTSDIFGGVHIKKSGQALTLETLSVNDSFDIQFYDADDLSGVYKWDLSYRGNTDPGDGSGPNALKLFTTGAGGTVMTWRYDGNVGIGTPSPQITSPTNNISTGNLDVNDVYLRSTGRWASQGVGATGGGFIPRNTTVNLGSNWTVVSLAGQYVVSDAGAAGGYIYKIGATSQAALFTATGSHNEFILTSAYQCSGAGNYSLCARLGGDGLYIRTGADIQVSYVKLR